ncbi:hypothetical protein [uncultured Nostoc sp.]|uniref:hypothetical protein n=1 Tax=uncultured Nostoc sp. TaxID=340711 RepID=UPI00345AC523
MGKLAVIIALRTILNLFMVKEIQQGKNKKDQIKMVAATLLKTINLQTGRQILVLSVILSLCIFLK